MDLGLTGKWALVCGASKGLGYACAKALATEGCNVVMVARNEAILQASANTLKDLGGATIIAVAADITTADGRARALAALPQVDILVTNAAGPPPGSFRDFDRPDWEAALNANMLTPIDLIKSCIDGMIERKFGRIVNITSMSVKAPINVLCLSNGARAGLTGFIGGLAREVAEHNVIINNLLPGMFDTDRLRSTNQKRAQIANTSVQEIEHQLSNSVPVKRFGNPDEFGHTCAFLCSANNSYITGQNIAIDGGAYPGLF